MLTFAVVGPIASGKSTVSKMLEENYGYTVYKLSRAIYDEADKLGLDKEQRVVLQDLGDKMRKDEGTDVLAKRAVKKYRDKDKMVFESIRNHHELEYLRESYGENLKIVSVTASVKTRYKRAVEREGQYKEQNTTFEEFQKISDRDLGIGNAENEQNVSKCMEMADFTIENEGSYEELKEKIKSILNDLEVQMKAS